MSTARPRVAANREPVGLGTANATADATANAASSAAPKAAGACAGFIEIKRADGAKRYTGGCRSRDPLGEILDPDGDTRVIIEACDDVTAVDVLGYTKTLPGKPTDVRVRLATRSNGREVVSKTADLTVTTLRRSRRHDRGHVQRDDDPKAQRSRAADIRQLQRVPDR